MMITRTHNAYHLGDNLVHLNFMRKVALTNPERQFIHAAQWQYLSQLKDLVADVPNLGLTDFNYMTPPDSIDAWRGANGFWYKSEIRNDFVMFHTGEWFPYLADRMKVENPVKCAKDMLFDYPALKQGSPVASIFDVLIINAAPSSGQFQSYNNFKLGEIAYRLNKSAMKDGRDSATFITNPCPEYPEGCVDGMTRLLSVTEIGHISLHCHTILMVSTGPSWPTFNIFNIETVKRRIILIDSERIWLSPNTFHCNSVEKASEILLDCGLL